MPTTANRMFFTSRDGIEAEVFPSILLVTEDFPSGPSPSLRRGDRVRFISFNHSLPGQAAEPHMAFVSRIESQYAEWIIVDRSFLAPAPVIADFNYDYHECGTDIYVLLNEQAGYPAGTRVRLVSVDPITKPRPSRPGLNPLQSDWVVFCPIDAHVCEFNGCPADSLRLADQWANIAHAHQMRSHVEGQQRQVENRRQQRQVENRRRHRTLPSPSDLYRQSRHALGSRVYQIASDDWHRVLSRLWRRRYAVGSYVHLIQQGSNREIGRCCLDSDRVYVCRVNARVAEFVLVPIDALRDEEGNSPRVHSWEMADGGTFETPLIYEEEVVVPELPQVTLEAGNIFEIKPSTLQSWQRTQVKDIIKMVGTGSINKYDLTRMLKVRFSGHRFEYEGDVMSDDSFHRWAVTEYERIGPIAFGARQLLSPGLYEIGLYVLAEDL